MLIIADSSALVALATCEALEILTELYDDIKVPQAVYDEVVIPGKPQAAALAAFLMDRSVPVDTTRFVTVSGGLGRGEIEAMLLYKTLTADFLLIDDRRARAVAESNQIQCVGTLGILLLAKQKNQIPYIAPFIRKLRNSSLFFSESILEITLRLADEQ